jgi:hypothetical protein
MICAREIFGFNMGSVFNGSFMAFPIYQAQSLPKVCNLFCANRHFAGPVSVRQLNSIAPDAEKISGNSKVFFPAAPGYAGGGQGSHDSRRITGRAGRRSELIVGELFHGVLDAMIVGQFYGRNDGVLLVL